MGSFNPLCLGARSASISLPTRGYFPCQFGSLGARSPSMRGGRKRIPTKNGTVRRSGGRGFSQTCYNTVYAFSSSQVSRAAAFAHSSLDAGVLFHGYWDAVVHRCGQGNTMVSHPGVAFSRTSPSVQLTRRRIAGEVRTIYYTGPICLIPDARPISADASGFAIRMLAKGLEQLRDERDGTLVF